MGRKSLEELKKDIEKMDIQIKELVKKEQAKKKDNLKIFIIGSLARILDIQNEDINKGVAIKRLQRELNIKPEECMAFGDQMNDYELFQNVHYSYAMKNAIQPLKEIAFQVIDSNDESGVTGKIKEILKGEL